MATLIYSPRHQIPSNGSNGTLRARRPEPFWIISKSCQFPNPHRWGVRSCSPAWRGHRDGFGPLPERSVDSAELTKFGCGLAPQSHRGLEALHEPRLGGCRLLPRVEIEIKAGACQWHDWFIWSHGLRMIRLHLGG
jgi:hypothetical protein